MTEPKGEASQDRKQGALSRLLSSIKFLVEPGLPVEDRRIAGRLDCALETSYLAENGDAGSGVVLDVSRRGLRMRTSRAIGKGLTLALKPPSGLGDGAEYAPLMARVMWTTKAGDAFLCGLLLPPGIEDEETWLEAYLASRGYNVGDPQRRKFVRAESQLAGTLAIEDQAPIDVLVLNLGLGGALIRAELSLEKNSPFRLHMGPHGNLPELELSGTILRQSQNEGEAWYYHSTRFGPLEERRHTLLKEYIVNLLKKRP
jgi:hypothetical protein